MYAATNFWLLTFDFSKVYFFNICFAILLFIIRFGAIMKMLCPLNWEGEIFKFLKEVFQGDPYSGVIFLIIFNPIIEYIKKQREQQGHE